VDSKPKKSGSEKKNSMREKSKVTTLRAPTFSFLTKRRTMAPPNGKKVNRDRMGIPKTVMKLAPFVETNDTNENESGEQRI
jgi:hypothetical protein